eukprot:tig00000342_g24229.t1
MLHVWAGVAVGAALIVRHFVVQFQESCIQQELSAAEEELRIYQARLADPLQYVRDVLDGPVELSRENLDKLAVWIHEKVFSDADVAEGQRLAAKTSQLVQRANHHAGAPAIREQIEELIGRAVDIERITGALAAWLRVHYAYVQLWVLRAEEGTLIAEYDMFVRDHSSLRDTVLRRFPYVAYRLVVYARAVDAAASRLEQAACRLASESSSSDDRGQAAWYGSLAEETIALVAGLREMHNAIVGSEDYDKHLLLLQQEQDRERLLEMQNTKLVETKRSNRVKEDSLYHIERSAERTAGLLGDLRRDVKLLTEVIDRRLKRVEEAVARAPPAPRVPDPRRSESPEPDHDSCRHC